MALISYDKPDRKKARYATSAGLAPVAQYPPNEFDLHDMAGSVTEWCSDWFERTCYESSPQETPQGPSEGIYRMVRSGTWSDGRNRITVSSGTGRDPPTDTQSWFPLCARRRVTR